MLLPPNFFQENLPFRKKEFKCRGKIYPSLRWCALSGLDKLRLVKYTMSRIFAVVDCLVVDLWSPDPLYPGSNPDISQDYFYIKFPQKGSKI